MKEKNNEHCEEALELLTQMFEAGVQDGELENLIAAHPDCARILRNQYRTWEELATLETPTPSSEQHARFYRTLNELQIVENKPSFLQRLGSRINQWLLELSPQARWVFIAGIFILGISSGLLINTPGGVKLEHLAKLDQDPEFLFIHSRPQQSAIDRMKEIQNIKEVKSPDEKIFKALNEVLLRDPNINVRLSAIETLVHFAGNPKVREYLIEAIPVQDSPLVQVALADAMLLLHEKRSSGQWQKLFESGKIETDVKMHLEETLEPLLY